MMKLKSFDSDEVCKYDFGSLILTFRSVVLFSISFLKCRGVTSG